MKMSDVEAIKPDWSNRRKVIKLSLAFFGVLLSAITIASFLLALFAKFSFYICLFATVIAGCIFVTYICIIGSYVFGSSFETKAFLKAITDIVPDFQKDTTITTLTETKIETDDSDTTES